MKLVFHPNAATEYDKASQYYQDISTKIAIEFVKEIEFGIKQVCEQPLLWPIRDGDTRRYLAQKFPYGIYYCIEEDAIVIYAVANLHRKPNYWIDCLG